MHTIMGNATFIIGTNILSDGSVVAFELSEHKENLWLTNILYQASFQLISL